MKRVICLLLVIFLQFSFTGCTLFNTKVEKTPITVNLPKDNSVNGYRKYNNSVSTEINNDNIIITHDTKTYSYFGNKNSKKFHKASCTFYKNTKSENIVFYKTRQEFIDNNYSPCKTCNP